MKARLAAAWLLALLGFVNAGRAPADTRGIVIDRDGRTLYYTDDRHRAGSVWRVAADGKSRPEVLAFGRHATDLFLDRKGVCFGLDVGRGFRTGRLWAVGSDRDTLAFAAPAAREGGGSAWGWGQFVLDDAGRVYFAYDHGVWVCGPDRRPRLLAAGLRGETDGRGPSARFGALGGMAWGQDGHLYVVDAGALRRVTREGAVSTFAKGLLDPEPGEVPGPYPPYCLGLTVDWRGNFYFTDEAYGRVRIVTPGGRVFTADRGSGGWRPTGVAVHRDTLYVLEHQGSFRHCYPGKDPRVRRIDADGRSAVLTTFDEPPRSLAEPLWFFPPRGAP